MNRKEFLIISVTIFLTVIAWVTADIIHSQVEEHLKNQVSLPTVQKYNINEQVFSILKSRTK